MTEAPDDRTLEPMERTDTSGPKHAGPRQGGWFTGVLRCIGKFVVECVGEFVGEFILQALSCLLLAGVVIGVVWGWHRSPGLTLGTLAVLLLGAVAVFTLWRNPGPGWARRVGVALLTVLAVLVAWFVLYGSNCGCV